MKKPRVANRAEGLVRRAVAGDPDAFDQLFHRHYNRVQRHLITIVGPNPDLDDLIQTTFLQVYRNLPRYRFEAKFTTWLYRITANVALGYLRRVSRRRCWEELAELALPDQPAIDEDPDEMIDRRGRLTLLYWLLGELNAKKRLVVVMHDLEGRSVAEIAKIAQVPRDTVSSRLRTARADLRRSMKRRIRTHLQSEPRHALVTPRQPLGIPRFVGQAFAPRCGLAG